MRTTAKVIGWCVAGLLLPAVLALAILWRLLAAQDVLLIDKVVAAASYRTSLSFISDLVRQVRLDDAQYSRLAALVTPLTADERSLAGVIAREYTGLTSTLSLSPEAAPTALGLVEERFERHFFKYHATLNAFWEAAERNQAASREPCARSAAAAGGTAPVKSDGWAYNPIGKILLRAGSPVFTEYILSMCDLAGMRNIVGLQLALHTEHVKDQDVPAFVMGSASKFPNPYDLGPLNWAAGDKTLGFRPLANRNAGFLPWPI